MMARKFNAKTQRRKGRKEIRNDAAGFSPVALPLYPVIPAFYPFHSPSLYPRHSRESGNPQRDTIPYPPSLCALCAFAPLRLISREMYPAALHR